MSGKIYIVGLGPGKAEEMTYRAVEALQECDIIAGYTTYIDLIKDRFPKKEYIVTGMKKEIDRCRMALEEAQKGKVVVLVSSGDAGVYGMAGIMYEVAEPYGDVELEVVPGITAACSGAALLGAPLCSRGKKSSSACKRRPTRISLFVSIIRAAKAGPIIWPGPVPIFASTERATRPAALSAISAGTASRPSLQLWPNWQRQKPICLRPSLSATVKRGTSKADS